MVEFKLNIGDKATKKTYKVEIKSPDADNFLNKKLGDKVRGELFGLNGYELEISGGSDNAGFPMISSIEGFSRKKVVLSRGKGFRKLKKNNEKKRKTVRGRQINSEIAQINLKVVKSGKDSIAKLLGQEVAEEKKTEEPKKEEAKEEKKEAKVEEKPAEKPKEEKPKKE